MTEYQLCEIAISYPPRWCYESAVPNMPANLENSAVATGLEKVSFHYNVKECSVTTWLHSSHTLAKVTFKILQARLQQYVNYQMFKLDLEKVEEPEIKLPISVGSSKKQDNSRKTSSSALLTMPKPLTVWITTNCGKFFKRWEYQTTWLASWEICIQVKKQQLELDMEQQLVPNRKRSTSRLYIVTLLT